MLTLSDMRDKGQLDEKGVTRLMEPAPPEAAHVLAVWHMVGGQLSWQEVLVAAEFHEGDAELLVEGLMGIRDEVRRWKAEQGKG